MKTINLNRLITLLCVTGMLLSCSNDDDISSVDPTPRNFNAPSGNEAVPIDLNFRRPGLRTRQLPVSAFRFGNQ